MTETKIPLKDYLLAAEADKIQDLIFRSSYLREVVGGSQLLTKFCLDIPPQISPESVTSDDIITSDGGSFRIMFEQEEDARKYGEKLAELYRLATGGNLTVADVIPTNDDYEKASDAAMGALRQAKQDSREYLATPQIPYMAFCASCGVGIAKKHRKLDSELPVMPQYLCSSCLHKAESRQDAGVGEFLKPFYDEIGYPKRVQKIPTPEDIAQFDGRNYVAYIVADGNGMGEVFSKCLEPKKMKQLSQAMTPALRKSLAEPTEMLLTHQVITDFLADIEKRGEREFIPVLPLIMGGDDLFVLLPAPWALDFTLRFAEAYKDIMKAEAAKIFDEEVNPSISAAVVICKASYPYYLAHQHGEALLSEAKIMGKRWGIENRIEPQAAITFEVILGNRIAGGEQDDADNRATLKPYWVGEAPQGWGIPLKTLLEQRLALANLPRKRLVQLRSIFDELPPKQPIGEDNHKKYTTWQKSLKKFLDRTTQRSQSTGQLVENTLAKLGGTDLYHVNRATDEKNWYGHGLPDLIQAWDYLLDLTKTISDYEGGE